MTKIEIQSELVDQVASRALHTRLRLVERFEPSEATLAKSLLDWRMEVDDAFELGSR